MVLAAMQEIKVSAYSSDHFCVDFVPREHEHDYVEIGSFTSGTG
jgi:hypothetical protein